VGDFELHFKYKLTDMDGKSDKFGQLGRAVSQQSRKSPNTPSSPVIRPDMECGKTYSGILYEEKGRGIPRQAR